jgi:Fic family protein
MKISEFKSGIFIPQVEYKSFLPEKINCEWIIDRPELATLLEEANLALGELNAYSRHVPDVDTFIRMHVIKEATNSSRIEGTQTEIEEAARHERLIVPEKRDDWHEVQNYIQAMNNAILSLKKLPLSSRLLREAHQTLMKGVRGQNKLPGNYRKSQNWIGGASLKDAVYIPPHHTEINSLISDLESFLHNRTIHVPHLIRIAIAHYQFEAIHPFLDGNGRIGRLLITLYLVSNQILHKPLLYLSTFFEKNRELYYDNLNRVRSHNDLAQWIKFFLAGIIDTAQTAVSTLQKILSLNEKLNNQILDLGKRAPLAKEIIQYLFKYPTITARDIIDEFKITKPTANTMIKEFIRINILVEKTGYKRNRIYIFKKYLDLFI